ncbi:Bacterial aa3 type cytochrome c oxidase subunit IV [Methyloligella halotolerans]|uniref:Bacterial aa3 type cytochrome c oxidase subunit IV n=1 Tax=Methyloligella halotolerans TaxID=1177755 RepID=A0A1E2RZ85_9HYPH|nr:aa3-type cytochrome c oxidase subunit IV [Methyloligella halotolerans]ODA67521.1 Bacterial aa3 type cytochrome c oxidase subunit IV [Methyloligella halotolerans]
MKINPADCHPDMDYEQHTSTYALFLKFAVWGTIATAALVLALAIFVA